MILLPSIGYISDFSHMPKDYSCKKCSKRSAKARIYLFYPKTEASLLASYLENLLDIVEIIALRFNLTDLKARKTS